MMDQEKNPERPEEEKQQEAKSESAATAPQAGGEAPGNGYFKPVPEPEAARQDFRWQEQGGTPAGAPGVGGAYGAPYGNAPGAGYRRAGVSNGMPNGNAPYPPTPPYGYPGQQPRTAAPAYPPKKAKKKGNTALIVAVIVLAFLLVVGVVAAGAYFVSERTANAGRHDFTADNDITSDDLYGEGSKKPGGNHAGSNVLYGDNSGFENKGSIVSDDAISNAAVFCSKSVVAITTSSASYSAFYGNYVTKGAGSGVLYAEQADDDGKVTGTYIVTNNHVIDGASEITVTLSDGTQYPAELVGTDSQTDVAVIYIPATDLKESLASLGESDSLLLGQTVLAIGNPLGELAGTVTDGIISCLEREIDIDGIKMNLLQTNAAVNPGNSGGGLFNLNGQMVGLVNAKSSGEGIEGLGFAIPVDTVKEIAGDLMANGYVTGRPKIGISGYEVTSENYQSYRTNSPEVWEYINRYYSASGGKLLEGWYIFDDSSVQYTDIGNTFKKGDVISAIGDKRIAGQSSITEILSGYEIGDTVTVTVWRLVESGNQFRPSYSIRSFDVSVVLTDTVPEVSSEG